MVSFALALLPLSGIVVYFASVSGWGVISQMQLAAILAIWFLALNKSRFPIGLRGGLVTALMVGGALGEVLRFGLFSPTFPLLAVLPVVAAAIGGFRWGLVVGGAICFLVAIIAWFMIATEPVPSVDLYVFLFDSENWMVLVVNIVVASGIGIFVTGALFNFHVALESKLRERNRELAASLSRNKRSAKLANLGFAVKNQITNQILDCDASYAAMHGYPAKKCTTAGSNFPLQDDDEAAAAFRKRLLDGEQHICEFRHETPDGDKRYLRKIYSPSDTFNPNDGVFDVISQDVTEARHAQEKVFQSQKMDAIGKLTGGVAHDFNNLLAVILGNLELVRDKITDRDQRKLIQAGIDASLHGAKLTRNMLSFAQQAQLAPKNIDLNQLVRNLSTWIERTLPASINVEVSTPADLWSVEIDASSAESALLNLILNARDAMPDGGRLTIEASNIHIDGNYLGPQDEEMEPGRYVMLAISDTGEGIPSENLKKIFEPFFTTKVVGSGSGLGLSMLEGFMRQSGGAVRVYSELGVGTTFKLFFAASVHERVLDVEPLLQAVTHVENARSTILLVEDNPGVLEVIQIALIKFGFNVIAASTGDAALEIFEQGATIDLLLTDIVMPGELQGISLAKAFRAKRPNLPVVFMSGYANAATVHENGLRPEDIRLMKPVKLENLLQAIQTALGQLQAK